MSTAVFPLPFEIRWHGRGGQGAVTASKLLAEVALDLGKHIQSFPQFGSERQGAPVVAYTRISDTPVQLYNTIQRPNVVIVLDPSLLQLLPVCEGLRDDGLVLVNTSRPTAELRTTLQRDKGIVATVPASGIALEHLGKPITNTAMLGAFLRATGFQELAAVAAHVRDKFTAVYTSDVVEANLRAMDEAYRKTVLG